MTTTEKAILTSARKSGLMGEVMDLDAVPIALRADAREWWQAGADEALKGQLADDVRAEMAEEIRRMCEWGR